jgi:hypothetical protein
VLEAERREAAAESARYVSGERSGRGAREQKRVVVPKLVLGVESLDEFAKRRRPELAHPTGAERVAAVGDSGHVGAGGRSFCEPSRRARRFVAERHAE